MHKLLKKQGFAPKLLVTDKLGSYGSAFRRDITHPNTWVFAFHIQLTL
jgi:transposase-like protein